MQDYELVWCDREFVLCALRTEAHDPVGYVKSRGMSSAECLVMSIILGVTNYSWLRIHKA